MWNIINLNFANLILVFTVIMKSPISLIIRKYRTYLMTTSRLERQPKSI